MFVIMCVVWSKNLTPFNVVCRQESALHRMCDIFATNSVDDYGVPELDPSSEENTL